MDLVRDAISLQNVCAHVPRVTALTQPARADSEAVQGVGGRALGPVGPTFTWHSVAEEEAAGCRMEQHQRQSYAGQELAERGGVGPTPPPLD